MSELPRFNPKCFLAAHGVYARGEMPPCEGRLVRAHLIPQQELKRSARSRLVDENTIKDLLWDPAGWVWACGGYGHGNAGHHGMFDSVRTIRIPRAAIPEATERFAGRLGLGWYLDREYGPR